jgi:hypothetical protein
VRIVYQVCFPRSRPENRHEVSIRPRPDADGGIEDVDEYLDRQREHETAPSPDEIPCGPGERVTALFEAVDGDDALTELLDAAMETGETTAKPLSERLRTTPADINNRLKKLRRAGGRSRQRRCPERTAMLQRNRANGKPHEEA